PSLKDAKSALEYLNDTLFSEFPFVTKVDRSVALSAVLSALDRRAMVTCPLHAFSSPTARTGKSLLVDLVSIMATGQPAPALTQSANEEELDKRINAALLRGDLIISIDNCDHQLSSNTLSHALTGLQLSIRELGYSRNISVKGSALFLANGNNLII